MILFLSTFIIKAQTISSTIPTDVGNFNTFLIPFDDYWQYSWTSQIITKDELLNTGGLPSGQYDTIKQLQFNLVSSPVNFTMTNQLIYIRTTSDSLYTAPFTFPGTNGFTQVFDGSLIFHVTSAASWFPVNINDFIWDGNSNIEILYLNEEGNYSNNPAEFASNTGFYPSGSNKIKYDWSDKNNVFGTCQHCNGANRSAILMRIGYTPSCKAVAFTTQPVSPPVICSPASAVFSVSASGDNGISYQWQVSNGSSN